MPLTLQLSLSLLVLIAVYYLSRAVWMNYQTKAYLANIKNKPFPQKYLSILEKIPHYTHLNEHDKESIHYSIRHFLYIKKFKGQHITITDEIRLSIAFFACLMVLRLPAKCYYPLRTIVVYPHPLVMNAQQQSGNSRHDFILQGLSLGAVMFITWNSAKKEIFKKSKHNVIIHELAHELDFESGAFNGIPPLNSSKYHIFSKVLYKRFRLLHEKIEKDRYIGKYKLLGAYASSHEAEFFAVMSELYFERPKDLKQNFPDIYKALNLFYQLDMAEERKA